MRQTAEGRMVSGADFGGSDPGADPAATARALFARTKSMLAGADDLVLDFHTVGYRPKPADSLPVVGRPAGVVGLWLAVMHSGITLAPAVGRFAHRLKVLTPCSDNPHPYLATRCPCTGH